MSREAPDSVRREVIVRAQGRCEYCLYPEGKSVFAHQVDHVVSRKHGGDATLNNLALCCIFCNRYKGSDVAAIDARTGDPVRLFIQGLTDGWITFVSGVESSNRSRRRAKSQPVSSGSIRLSGLWSARFCKALANTHGDNCGRTIPTSRTVISTVHVVAVI